MIVVLYGCLVALVISMALVLIRLQRGPGNLDRAIALDVITSASVGIVVVMMAVTGRIDPLPLLVVFTSVGFIGATTIARFSQAESISERRILTSEEAASVVEPEFDESDAPVHPDADDLSDDDELELAELDQAELDLAEPQAGEQR